MALVKLTIESFEKADCSGSPLAKIKAMFNPETYKKSFRVRSEPLPEHSTSATTMSFQGMGPNELNFKFIVDGTNIVSIPGALTVDSYIKKFTDGTIKFNGNTHRPNFLKITWGKLSFLCICESIDINYTLFNSDGTALRATLDTKFTETTDPVTKAMEAQKKSPDLTHIVTVRSGDTLPLMTYRIYGDSSYYMQVAAANNLTSVHAIKPGDQLFFPPIHK